MSDLVDRLRGKYVIPVRDGAGPLNGKDTFTRQFETPPIHHEAAARIEALEGILDEIAYAYSSLPQYKKAKTSNLAFSINRWLNLRRIDSGKQA